MHQTLEKTEKLTSNNKISGRWSSVAGLMTRDFTNGGDEE